MKIKVKLINQFKQYGGNKLDNNKELKISENYKIKDLIEYLEISEISNKTILVNGRRVDKNKKLNGGDKVVIYKIISGG